MHDRHLAPQAISSGESTYDEVLDGRSARPWWGREVGGRWCRKHGDVAVTNTNVSDLYAVNPHKYTTTVVYSDASRMDATLKHLGWILLSLSRANVLRH